MSAQVDLSRYAVPQTALDAPSDVPLGEYVGNVWIDDYQRCFFYARLKPARRLQVVLHGAVRAGQDSYPRFDRVGSTHLSPDALLSFADPTIGAYPKVLLGWYLGGVDWDPMHTMVDLIKASARAIGAEEILLVGGSGGGFAALQLALRLRGSMAFVFNPQTAILRYQRIVVANYFRHAYPDSTAEAVVSERPERFDAGIAYARSELMPRVFYAQSLSDSTHLTQHYIPFKRALNLRAAQGELNDAPIRFELYDGIREGHGPPLAHEYFELLQCAIRWGENRSASADR